MHIYIHISFLNLPIIHVSLVLPFYPYSGLLAIEKLPKNRALLLIL